MPTPLVDYYRELQCREGFEVVELITEWDDTAIDEILNDFRTALGRSQITQQVVPIRPGSSNQSVGNPSRGFLHAAIPWFPD